jgi:hypothetical protein
VKATRNRPADGVSQIDLDVPVCELKIRNIDINDVRIRANDLTSDELMQIRSSTRARLHIATATAATGGRTLGARYCAVGARIRVNRDRETGQR